MLMLHSMQVFIFPLFIHSVKLYAKFICVESLMQVRQHAVKTFFLGPRTDVITYTGTW